MKSEELHKWSEAHAIKRRINMILRSKRLGYWRICSKGDQKYFIEQIKLAKQYEDEIGYLKATLRGVVLTYEKCINAMEKMCDKERKTKLKTLHRYAEGRF